MANRTTVRFSWHGPREFAKLRIKLIKGLINAANDYKTKIETKLLETSGSDPVGGNLRIRRRHSSAGSVPFWQTKNLGQSIITSFTFGIEVLKARISTRVKYAVTLEKGGQLTTLPGFKRFTSIRLVNPLKSDPSISPRPVWIPTFERNRLNLINIITKPARNVI